jgi:hypothetical protein
VLDRLSQGAISKGKSECELTKLYYMVPGTRQLDY